MLVVLKVFHPL